MRRALTAVLPAVLAVVGCNSGGEGSSQSELVVVVREGCTDPEAINFDPDADTDDGSCQYEVEASGLEARLLAGKLDILKTIEPGAFVDRLNEQQARAVPMGKLDASTLLVYEANSGAVVTIDLCEACTTSTFLRSPVAMHWSRENIEEELLETWGVLALNPAFSFDLPGDPVGRGVKPIALEGATFRGWVLAFETNSGSIVAFKKDPRFRRVPAGLADPVKEDHPNFGFGNGLLMAVVISGQDIVRQLDRPDARVSRIFELEDGKILVFFTQVRDVHLLELELQPSMIDFDFADENAPFEEVMVPRGTFRVFPGSLGTPESFLSFQFIQQQVTDQSTIDLDTLQPLYLPPSQSGFCGGPGEELPDGGAALVFDAGSSSFLRIWEDTDASSPRFRRGLVALVSDEDAVEDTLRTPPPYVMLEAAYSSGCTSAVVFEQRSRNLFSIDIEQPMTGAEGSLKITAGATDFLQRRHPGAAGDVVAGTEETVLKTSENNIRGSRLYFDQTEDQLIAVHFETGNVVVVASRGRLERITDRPLANFTWIEALPAFSPKTPHGGGEVLRVFDTESTALLELRLRYGVLPVFEGR